MKLNKILQVATFSLFVALQGTSRAATITYVGTLSNSTETVNWLSPSTAKSYDIDGDNKYGSYAAIQWLSYTNLTAVSVSRVSNGNQFRQPEYAKINDLGDACQGNLGPGSLVNANPTNSSGSIVNAGQATFQVNADLTGMVLRVGIMADLLGSAEYPRDIHKALHISQTAGTGTWSSVVPLPSGDGRPEMVFFDLANAQVGDRFLVEQLVNVDNVGPIGWVVGPVSFDTNGVGAASAPPQIRRTTGGGQFSVGASCLLGVLAGGAPAPTYQWYRNGAVVAGATSSASWLTNLALSDAGSYSVVATTPAGSVTSSPVAVSVVSSGLPSSVLGYRAAVAGESGLLSYYTMDDAGKDIVGTNSGVMGWTVSVGYNQTAGIGGGSDKAMLFGADGRLQLGAVPAFSFPSNVGTFEAWVRADWTNTPTYSPCIAACRDSSGTRWSLHMNPAKDVVGIYNGSVYQTQPIIPAAGTNYNVAPVLYNGPYSTNWHHLAVIFNPGQWTLVWDGQIMGTNLVQSLGAGTTTQVEIGSSSTNSWQENWLGAIDEVAFYTNALSFAQVRAHYDSFLTNLAPQIVRQPEGRSLLAGNSYQGVVAAIGGGLSYQWYQNGAPVAGATTSALTFPSIVQSNAGSYVCMVTNLNGAVSTTPIALQVSNALSAAALAYQAAVLSVPSLVSYYPFNDGTANDAKGTHSGTMMGAAPPMRGLFGAGFDGGPGQAYVSGGTGSPTTSGWINLGTSSDFAIPAGGMGTIEMWVRAGWNATPGYNPVLFSVRSPTSSTGVDFSIHMRASKASIILYNGSTSPAHGIPNAGYGWHHLAVIINGGTWTTMWDGVQIATTSQSLSGALSSAQIGSSLAIGQEWWIGGIDEVAFYSDALAPSIIKSHYNSYYALVPPIITTQPAGGLFVSGSEVDLAPAVTGPNLVSQWYKNGTAIAGANNLALTLYDVTSTNSGNYTLVVTNLGGAVTSAVATVTVVTPQPLSYEAAAHAEPSVISLYTFDDQTANDCVGTNNGVMNGTGLFTSGIGGGTNMAYYGDGISDWIVIDPATAFDFRNSEGVGTVEAWVRADFTSDPGYAPTVLADSDGANVNYQLVLGRTKTTMGGFTIPSPVTNWHLVTMVFYYGMRTVYWDGVAITAPVWQPLYAQIPAVPMVIGAGSPIDSAPWIGAIDDVSFYSDALSEAAIQSHYLAMMFGNAPIPLNITQLGGSVTVSWSASATGWTLESAAHLPAASWSPVSGVVSNSVTLPATSSAAYFRLRSP